MFPNILNKVFVTDKPFAMYYYDWKFKFQFSNEEFWHTLQYFSEHWLILVEQLLAVFWISP